MVGQRHVPHRPPSGSQAAIPPDPEPAANSGIVPPAFEFKRLLDSGEVRNRAELARRFGVSRARVTQIMSILNLPAPVVDALSTTFPDEKSRVTERRLRAILSLPTEQEQSRAFEELRASAQEPDV